MPMENIQDINTQKKGSKEDGKAGLWGIWVPLAEVMLWAFSGNLRLNFLFYLVPVSYFVSYDSGDLCILVESN